MSDHLRTIAGPAKGRLAAWHAPDAGLPWWPIDAMPRVFHLPVIVSLNETAAHVVAEMRKFGRARRPWWFQLGVWDDVGYQWMRYAEIELEPVGREPPGRNSPVAFRPLDLARWVHPLPKPLTPAQGPSRPPPANVDEARPCPEEDGREDFDPHLASDGWPHPGLPLTLGLPASLAECEARILRGFRTSASRGGGASVGHVSRALCSDIPSELVRKVSFDAERARVAAGEYDLEAVQSGWTPTKRDLADWDTALSWLNALDRRSVRIVALRAANPPFSFRQIAERLRVKSHNGVRAMYAAAMEAAFRAAAGNGQQAGGRGA